MVLGNNSREFDRNSRSEFLLLFRICNGRFFDSRMPAEPTNIRINTVSLLCWINRLSGRPSQSLGLPIRFESYSNHTRDSTFISTNHVFDRNGINAILDGLILCEFATFDVVTHERQCSASFIFYDRDQPLY